MTRNVIGKRALHGPYTASFFCEHDKIQCIPYAFHWLALQHYCIFLESSTVSMYVSIDRRLACCRRTIRPSNQKVADNAGEQNNSTTTIIQCCSSLASAAAIQSQPQKRYVRCAASVLVSKTVRPKKHTHTLGNSTPIPCVSFWLPYDIRTRTYI